MHIKELFKYSRKHEGLLCIYPVMLEVYFIVCPFNELLFTVAKLSEIYISSANNVLYLIHFLPLITFGLQMRIK